MKCRTSRRAVTLVEMLVVVAIIVILAAITTILWGRLDAQAKEKAILNTFGLLDGALAAYHEDQGGFPLQPQPLGTGDPNSHSQLLVSALQSVPASRQVLDLVDRRWMKDQWPWPPRGVPDGAAEIYDPWETAIDYLYRTGDSFPGLRSAGPDKKFATADDIKNR